LKLAVKTPVVNVQLRTENHAERQHLMNKIKQMHGYHYKCRTQLIPLKQFSSDDRDYRMKMPNTMQHLINELPGFDIMLKMPRAKSMLESMSNLNP